jgi:lambda family phage portal protein
MRQMMLRMYGAAKMSRINMNLGGGGATTEDAETASSLARLRAGGRQLIRDSAYAKRAQTIIVNNVIGSGIDIQAQVETTRGEQNAAVNEAIEEAWEKWSYAENCHVGGSLCFYDMERVILGEVVESGDHFVRKLPFAVGRSEIPLALELIESERLADQFSNAAALNTATTRLGIERDIYGRALAYWIRNIQPGDMPNMGAQALAQFFRIPASEILHLRLIKRWPQTRGVPWFHAVAQMLNDMQEYATNELAAAKASAAYFATITKPSPDFPVPGMPAPETDSAGNKIMEIQPLAIEELLPGEALNFHTPNRPNQAFESFMKGKLREAAAGLNISYAALSQDYSETNYSSSRLSLLDDRDNWQILQQWWVRTFREPLHRAWMNAAVLAGAIPGITIEAYARDPERYNAVRFKLRGWNWVDPEKEVAAYKEAVKAGFISTQRVVEMSGGDVEDNAEQMKNDKEVFAAAGVKLDTEVLAAPPPTVTAPPMPSKPQLVKGQP